MKVAFIHPDLGIGGAERLVVDAAVGLQKHGHEVVLYTSHCDKSHCFEEIKDDTLNVEVLGDWLIPPNFFGRFAIICAILRQLHLTYALIRRGIHYDVFLVDQLSACIPFLRVYTEGRILFYGHFPDQLLSKRTNLIKKLYRVPFDWFERWSTGFSDLVVVNSKFTRKVFKKVIPLVRMPEVVYPCVDVTAERKVNEEVASALKGYKIAISVNRFERAKKIDLAVESFALANQTKSLLIVAGGYDTRVAENVEYHRQLQEQCDKHNLPHVTIWNSDKFEIPKGTRVVFLPSVSTEIKNTALSLSKILLYTPVNEHFGIVPLEGMLAKVPVLATDTGGPLETIVDGKTGWNRPQDANKWAEIIKVALNSDLSAMGQAGKDRVEKEFSVDKMALKFNDAVDQSRHVHRPPAVQFENTLRILKSIVWIAFFSTLWGIFGPNRKQ